MKILPINNTCNQNRQFKAKFAPKDTKEFLREIENNDVDIVPKLYTMLDIIKNLPGEKAEIQHIGLWHRILIDGNSINMDNKYFNAFHALFDAVVNTKDSLLKETPIKRLSENEFVISYYKNSKKTVQDIENIFKE